MKLGKEGGTDALHALAGRSQRVRAGISAQLSAMQAGSGAAKPFCEGVIPPSAEPPKHFGSTQFLLIAALCRAAPEVTRDHLDWKIPMMLRHRTEWQYLSAFQLIEIV
jgi:hypothetical protein